MEYMEGESNIETEKKATSSGYGVYEDYQMEHSDPLTLAAFDEMNRIASCMIDFLAGRTVNGESRYVREAVHWQIWFMRQKGSLSACFSREPVRETFSGYTVERSASGGPVKVFGMEVCPVTMQLLRVGGVLSHWI